MISKELFVKCLDAIEAQYTLEEENSKTLCSMFNTKEIHFENSLYKPLIEVLRVWFPKDDDGFCEIDHYCFEQNFGRESEIRTTDAEELYDKLKIKHSDIFSNPECWELVSKDKIKPKKLMDTHPFAHPGVTKPK